MTQSMNRNSWRTSSGSIPRSYNPLTSRTFHVYRSRRRPPRLQRLELGQHHHGERVRIGLQLLVFWRVVQQLDNRELGAGAEAPAGILIPVGPPGRVVVGQDRQADHLAAVAVEDPMVIDVHPLGEVVLLPALHLDVDQQPLLLAALEPDLDQLVDVAPAVLGRGGRSAGAPCRASRSRGPSRCRRGLRGRRRRCMARSSGRGPPSTGYHSRPRAAFAPFRGRSFLDFVYVSPWRPPQ